MVTTTLKRLRAHKPCKERYAHLRHALGVKYGDDTPIDIITILDANGLSDVLWIPTSALTGDNISTRYRLFAVACCRDILHLMRDARSVDAVRVAHLYAHGDATDKEMAAARDAAWAAARAADSAAACDAAWAAAWAAAWDAAGAKQVEHFRIIFSADLRNNNHVEVAHV